MQRETILIAGLGAASILFAMTLAAWLTAPAPETATASMAARPALARAGPAMAPGERPDATTILQRIDALRARLMANPEDAEGWRMLGRSYMSTGRYRDAVEAWSWVQELVPGDPQAAGALQQLRSIAEQGGRHPPTGR